MRSDGGDADERTIYIALTQLRLGTHPKGAQSCRLPGENLPGRGQATLGGETAFDPFQEDGWLACGA